MRRRQTDAFTRSVRWALQRLNDAETAFRDLESFDLSDAWLAGYRAAKREAAAKRKEELRRSRESISRMFQSVNKALRIGGGEK